MGKYPQNRPVPSTPTRDENDRNSSFRPDSGLGQSSFSTPTKTASLSPSPTKSRPLSILNFNETTHQGNKTSGKSPQKRSYADVLKPGSHDRYQNTGDLAQSQAGHEKSEWNISPGTPEKLDPNKFYGNKFKKQALFKIHPPKTFPYEIRMTSNSTKQGLLYTITKPERIEYWQRILSHYGSSSSLEKVADYIKGKQVIQLSNDQFVETYNIQIEAFNSVEEIMTDDNYLGEGQNYEGKPQLYWEIKDMHRNFPIMVMGMSKESNPFAEIITIFFIDQFEYNRRKRNGWITKH